MSLSNICKLRLLLLYVGALVSTQLLQAGQIKRNGNQATLSVYSGRPLHEAAAELAKQFGILISVEDPPYSYRGDVQDVTAEVPRVPNLGRRILVPKTGRLEVSFAVRSNGTPKDIPGLVRRLVAKTNAQLPYAYRIDTEGETFTIVPTRSRNRAGRIVSITPLLDRHVNIPLNTRTAAETARLLADELSRQTGLRVHCCQSHVGGVPWGMETITFMVYEESARSVLRRLIVSTLHGNPNRVTWMQTCDPSPSPWCFVNFVYVAPDTRIEIFDIPTQPFKTPTPSQNPYFHSIGKSPAPAGPKQ